MGIKVALEHRTSYTFDRMVEVYPHVVRLRPAPHSRTPIEAYSLHGRTSRPFINWQQDAFGNFLARLVFPSRTRSLTVTVGLIADLKVINPFDFFIEDCAERIGFEYPKALVEDLKPYLRPVDEDDEGSGPGRARRKAWVKNFSVATGHPHHRLPGGAQSAPSTPTSATASAWNLVCRRRTSRCVPGSAPAATRRGCWCRSCASWAWPPGSCPATWCS